MAGGAPDGARAILVARRRHLARASGARYRLERFLTRRRGLRRGCQSDATGPALSARNAGAAYGIADSSGCGLAKRKQVGAMRTSLFVRTLVVMLALEWELCNEDPV